GDTICDGIDDDDDDDGVVDTSDTFPLNANEQIDTDSDCGTIAPLDQNTTSGDGCGDNSDDDIDGDGYLNADDAFDLDNEAWTDTDNDGLADDFPNLVVTVPATYYTISGLDAYSDDDHILRVTHSDGTVLCQITVDLSSGVSCPDVHMTSGTALVEVYSDYYYNEWDVTIVAPNGVSTTYDYSDLTGCSYSGCRGSFYSLTTLDVLTTAASSSTPSSSLVGTLLDYDDDGDNVLDVNENAGCELIADCDGDLDNDDTDQFPLNPAEWDDTDGDAPSGSDGTGYGDNSDAFPLDACANVDTDLDGMPDSYIGGCTSADTSLVEDDDDDGDGVLDAYDDFDDDASETTDTDGDTIGDNTDTDDDNDGYLDTDDWNSLDSSEWWVTDADGIGNNADYDDDGDGLSDEDDLYPLDKDNDQWDDLYEEACGTDKNDAQSTPIDTDSDTVKLAYPGALTSGQTDAQASATNLCDTLDTDDDNDGYDDVVDAFRTDDEVWIDTDNDGKADYIDPNSSQYSFGTTTECSISNSGSSQACPTVTFAPTNSQETLELVFGDGTNWAYEMSMTVAGPGGISDSFTSGDATASYDVAGDYTITLYDSYGDGGGYVTVYYRYVSGTVPATITDDGVLLDYDDDGDGYTDLHETTDCNVGTYASTSDPLDSASIPADMDNDLSCDALDTDRDGDTYDNGVDVFPDDVTEWVDTDGDTIGDNADTDDDADGVLDVDDHWSLLDCAAHDFDGDGLADSVDQSKCDIGFTAHITQTGDVGVADGDYIGITTGSIYNPTPVYAGINHYTAEDTDGIFNLNFDYITADSVSVAIVIESAGWEISDYIYVAFIGESATVSIYDSRVDVTSGDLDDSGLEDTWTVVSGDISAAGFGYLTIEMVSNAADEEFGIDDIIFMDSSSAVITQQGFENLAGAYTTGYPSFTGGVNTAHPNYGESSTGVPKWVCGDGSLKSAHYVNDGGSPDCADGSDEGATNWYVDMDLENTATSTVSWGGDGVRQDQDDDNDGYLDHIDVFPYDVTEWIDTDGDTIGNNADLDDDGDGTYDIADPFPLDLNAWTDTDGDGLADTLPPLGVSTEYTLWVNDSWSDGGHGVTVTDSSGTVLCSISGSSYGSGASCTFVLSASSADVDVDSDTWYYEGSMDITSPSGLILGPFTWSSSAGTTVTLTEQSDTTYPASSPLGTVLDNDDDNDGYNDDVDACPTQGTAAMPDFNDNDGDGLCDNADLDDDNDGHSDFVDIFPLDALEWLDADGDGIGDNADPDDDNDLVDDTSDAFQYDACASEDFDGDGKPDTLVAGCTTTLVEDLDDDNDLVLDVDDAWPFDQTRSTDTDGDGLADFVNGITPGDSFDFEAGPGSMSNTSMTNWTLSQCTGYGYRNFAGTVHTTCTPSTLHGPWTVSTDDPIAGTYSIKSGQLSSGSYGEIHAEVTFVTSGGDITWDWKVSSYLRSTVNTGAFTDGLKVLVDGVMIDASQYGGCINGEWCGEDSGSMTWSVGAGTHTIDFFFDFGTGNSAGSSEAWIDNLQLPSIFVSINEDLDDDNDGVLDEDDFDSLDKCISVDADGDGIVDDVSTDPDCDAADYTVDDNDDNDAWTDADEITCGSDPLDDMSVPADYDGDSVCDVVDSDDDNDGTDDDSDAFDFDNTEDTDTDGDTIGDNADPDDDNDGVIDIDDAFPYDSSEWSDYDGDDIGDNTDDDIDGDGVLNDADAFDFDDSEDTDSDGDGLGDNEDPDDDNDGYYDVADAFPYDSSEWSDLDGDDIGDNTDDDIDGDGVLNDADAFDFDPLESNDLDGDGIGDNSDPDDDGDGYNDGLDAFPQLSGEWLDSDGDGIGDNTDLDDDDDGIPDVDDAFSLNPSETSDSDGDGIGDNQDTDDDNDGVSDVDDAFANDADEDTDTDGDGIGNEADADDDNDEVSDALELECGSDPLDSASIPSDIDGDDICDAKDDDDNDGPLANQDKGTQPGWDNALPGFTGVISTLALLGAAIGVGLSGRRKND
ncbi:MAG: hypothetical protein P8Q35_02485, partial [Candidatus Thalassarchaeaceae archaeon]|nr:hypothetical protein [Candidatus Thalassarchaeaceae archaeon]